MVWILVKKQMMEIFKGYFYNSKKNKKRSAISTALFMLMYGILMVGILGGMFGYLSVQLCRPFAAVGVSWLYFVIMCMIAIALGTFGSVFNTYTCLYMSKDNDLLLSLPLPVRSILVARLISVYLLGLMYSAVVIIPAVIVYWICAKCTLLSVIGSVLFVFLISFVVLILSCILGWCVAKISKKLKNKSFITVLASLLFFAAYYFVYFKAQQVIMKLMENAVIYGENVKKKAYPVYMLGKIGEGDILAMLIYTVVILALLALTYHILAGSFINIVTSNNTAVRIKYKEKRSRMKHRFSAVLSKEFSRFVASPSYILNCGLGTLFLIVFGCLLLAKGNAMMIFIDMFFDDKEALRKVPVACVSMICMIAAMNDIVVPSVSLEGKNIWLIRSLPVKTWDVLKAKMAVQLLVTGIPVIFCDICMITLFQQDMRFEVLTLLFIVPIAFTVFMTFFGMFLGLCMPNLTWTNETAPIKQSLNVIIALFGGWIFAGLILGIFALKGYMIGIFAYLLAADAILIVCSLALYIWIKKVGTVKFESL